MAKLHLGCGSNYRDGFINIDFGSPADIHHDLSTGLPVALPEFDYVYSCHFFEHLYDADALNLMMEIKNRMQSPGILRILVPDFELVVRHYTYQNEEYFNLIPKEALRTPPNTYSLIDQMTYCVYQYGEHKSIWDSRKLETYLLKAGFDQTHVTEFNPEIDPDSPERRRYSLCMEGMKTT